MRGTESPLPPEHDDHHRGTYPRGSLYASRSSAWRTCAGGSSPERNAAGADYRAGTLQGRCGPEALARLPDQYGALASACRQVEWEIPSRRQWRLGRVYSRTRAAPTRRWFSRFAPATPLPETTRDIKEAMACSLLGHPEKVIDFAYRAMHEMTVQSKALIKRSMTRARAFPITTVALRAAGRD